MQDHNTYIILAYIISAILGGAITIFSYYQLRKNQRKLNKTNEK